MYHPGVVTDIVNATKAHAIRFMAEDMERYSSLSGPIETQFANLESGNHLDSPANPISMANFIGWLNESARAESLDPTLIPFPDRMLMIRRAHPSWREVRESVLSVPSV